MKGKEIGAVVALTGSIVLLSATAANAVTTAYNGSKACQGTTYPSLSIDAKGPGTLTWVNLVNATPSTYSFPGGHSNKYSPYQDASWAVHAAAGFYWKPTASCI